VAGFGHGHVVRDSFYIRIFCIFDTVGRPLNYERFIATAIVVMMCSLLEFKTWVQFLGWSRTPLQLYFEKVKKLFQVTEVELDHYVLTFPFSR